MAISGPFPDKIDNATLYVMEKGKYLENSDFNEIMKIIDETAKKKCDSFYELGFSMAKIQELKRKGFYNEAVEEVNSLDAELKRKRENAIEFWHQCIDLYDNIPDCGRKGCLENLFNYHSQRFGAMEIMLREFYNRNVYMKNAKME